MSVCSLSLVLILALALPFYSAGAPSNKELQRLKRARDALKKMENICNNEEARLDDLIYTTRRAYAKEHFGDPSESRQVDISGVELLRGYQEMTVQTFVPKAYKQLSIFHAVFQNILQHWPHEREGNRKIIDKVKSITNKIAELKEALRIAAGWWSGSADDSVPPSGIPQLSHVWNRSAYQQHKWILGVLGKFETSMTYLLPALRKFSKE